LCLICLNYYFDLHPYSCLICELLASQTHRTRRLNLPPLSELFCWLKEVLLLGFYLPLVFKLRSSLWYLFN
jgi:hypothetical protein